MTSNKVCQIESFTFVVHILVMIYFSQEKKKRCEVVEWRGDERCNGTLQWPDQGTQGSKERTMYGSQREVPGSPKEAGLEKHQALCVQQNSSS